MSEEERFEIQIHETREIVRRMDRQIELVERLLAESETSIRVGHGDFTNSIGMELVWCPPGTFWMGSPEDEESRRGDETLHQVMLTRGFWIGRKPVTQGQWEKVMGYNPSFFKKSGSDAPVEQLTWHEAQEFCRALGQHDGREYRLPTEAEWEYACRAGSTGAWCFGDDEEKLGDYAWHEENSNDRTHPVGQKMPNAWGIHDVHGNVWEWCQDWYGYYPEGSTNDPLGPEGGYLRVLRGGFSFRESISYTSTGRCRSASRRWDLPAGRYYFSGFRVAVSSTP
jgi:formylglycine-generating enzyme required for sulfatase activity